MSITVAVWLSTLAGPFSFVDEQIFRQEPIWTLCIALFLLPLIICHPVWPRRARSAVLTVIGVTLWVFVGFANTYMGV